MLDLELISPPLIPDQPLSISSVLAPSNRTTLLARSRRPAILPYQSPITSLANTFLSLPLHTLSIRDIDATKLSVSMFEQVSFARGWRNIPLSARLEVQTQPHTQAALLGQPLDVQQHVPMQIYSACIEFHARFRGLRWWMYNWRILSFLTFTSGFYCVALLSTGIAWGLMTFLSSSSSSSSTIASKEEEQQKKIKKEADNDRKTRSSNGHATRPIKTEPVDERDEEAASGEESPFPSPTSRITQLLSPHWAGRCQSAIPYPLLFSMARHRRLHLDMDLQGSKGRSSITTTALWIHSWR